MLMRRPSEMLNRSSNFLKRTYLSGKKRKKDKMSRTFEKIGMTFKMSYLVDA
jgi:hypothetical protein